MFAAGKACNEKRTEAPPGEGQQRRRRARDVSRDRDERLGAGGRSDGPEPGLGEDESLIGRRNGDRRQLMPIPARLGEGKEDFNTRDPGVNGVEGRRLYADRSPR
jgi:hypothetical protein